MRATHTFAELEISSAAYDEIRAKLEAAGYQHAFVALEAGVALDMHGIGLTRAAPDSNRVEATQSESFGIEQRSSRLARELSKEPGGFVTSEQVLTEAEREEIRRAITAGYLGAGNAGRPMILESGKPVFFERRLNASKLNLVEVFPC